LFVDYNGGIKFSECNIECSSGLVEINGTVSGEKGSWFSY